MSQPHFSASECMCSKCGEIFGSVAAFDLHQPWVECDTSRTTKSGRPLLRSVQRCHKTHGERRVWVSYRDASRSRSEPLPPHESEEVSA